MSKILLKLVVEEISDKDAVESLFTELKQYPWIRTVSIQWGGLLSGQIEKRHFYVDRMLEKVGLERQLNLKRIDKSTIREMRKELDRLERNAPENVV